MRFSSLCSQLTATSFCQQCPSPPSCLISSQPFTSGHHKLLKHILCSALHVRDPKPDYIIFVGNSHVLLHANFCPNLIILATTFCLKDVNSCAPYEATVIFCALCHFIDNAHVLLHVIFIAIPKTVNNCV